MNTPLDPMLRVPFEEFSDASFSLLALVREGRVVFANAAARQAFDMPPSRPLIGTMLFDLLDGAQADWLRAQGLARVADEAPRSFQAIGRGGVRFDILLKVQDSLAHPGDFVIAIKDVTDILHAASALWGREQHLVRVFESVTDGLVMIDRHGRVIRFNAAAERMFGLRARDIVGQSMAALLPDQDGVRHDRYIAEYERTGHSPVVGGTRQIIARRADGALFPAEISVSHTTLDGTGYFTAILRDITARVEAEEALERLALTDAVTGLPNRAALRRMLQARLGAAKHLPVFQIDLDNFRWVNESYGHETGDAVLRAIGVRLVSALDEADVVAHPGGDEFVIIPDCDIDALQGRIETALNAAAQGVVVNGYDIHVGASAGAAIGPDDGAHAEDLLRNLEAAVYAAKDSGRAAIRRYDRAIADAQAARRNIVSDLRRALDSGEIETFYQPKTRLSDGAIIGMEALARWRSPNRGLVSPDLFIGVAERANLIGALGHQVLESAVRDTMIWNAARKTPLKVAVNLSPRQFRDFRLPATILAVLKDYGLPPEQLEVEITESGLMTDIGGVIDALHRLKEIGVTIAIDDFGTGYSALAYLRRFPVDILKIDRSFTADTPDDVGAAALARSIASMAHSLDLDVVVEGVETAEQARFFRDLDCRFGQGWLYGRACDRATFAATLGVPAEE